MRYHSHGKERELSEERLDQSKTRTHQDTPVLCIAVSLSAVVCLVLRQSLCSTAVLELAVYNRLASDSTDMVG